jgi:large subunit ribosomal protein L25
MAQTVLNAAARQETGKGIARRLRREGRIPGVVYGHSGSKPLSVDAREFYKTFHAITESTIITLDVDSVPLDVLIKDYSEDIQTGKILHIDFYEIEQGKKLRTHIEIHLEGSPIGVREGGILEHSLYELEIECLPKDIPENVTVDISGMKTGDSLHVSDLVIPEEVRILNSLDQQVAAVVVPRAIEEEVSVEEEMEEEVAVIGEEEESDEEE